MPTPTQRKLTLLVLNALAIMALWGCATKEFVQQEVGAVNSRIEELQARLMAANSRIDFNGERLSGSEARIGKVEATTGSISNSLADSKKGLDHAHQRLDDLLEDMGKACFRIGENKQAIADTNQRLEGALANFEATGQRLGQVEERLNATDQRVEGALLSIATAREKLANLENTLPASMQANTSKGVEVQPAPMMEVKSTALMEAAPLATAGTTGLGAPVSQAGDANAKGSLGTVPTTAQTGTTASGATNDTAAATVVAATTPANATIASTGAAGETASKLDAIAAQIEAANQRISSNAASIETAAKRLNTLEDTLDSVRKGSENELIVLAKADRRLADIQAQIDATKQTQTTGAEAIANVVRRVDSIEMAIAKPAAQASQNETVSAVTGKSAYIGSQPALAAISQQTSEPQSQQMALAIPAQTGGHMTAPDTAKPVDDMANDAARIDLRIAEVEQALAFNKTADINTAKLVAELQAQVSATQQTVAGNTDVIAGATKRMDTLDASMARMDARIADGERSLTAKVASDSDVAKLVAELQASLASLDKRLAGDEQSLTDNSAADAETRIRVGALEAGTAAIAGTTGQLQAENKDQGKRITSLEAGLASVSATAKEALGRAIAAGKLAEGKLLFETVLSEAVAEFAFDKATLPKAAKAELKTLAEKLKAENQNVYIEIQGHTDNVGGTAGNMALGQERAEAVMTYLNSEFGIPLHRMSALSYGESRPVADNKTKSGRAQNRRVVLVVLK